MRKRGKIKRVAIAGVLLFATLVFLASGKQAMAVATNITLTASDANIIIKWLETSSEPVEDYEIEISTDGGVSWHLYPDAVSSSASLNIPRSAIGYFDADIPISVRIKTIFSNSSTELSSIAHLMIPSIYTKTDRFTIGSPELVMSNSTRKTLGLNVWLDGSIGFFKRNGQVSSVSSNGEFITKINFDENNVLTDTVYTDRSILNNTTNSDYASGGPIYYDEPNDRLIMFYHGEFYDPSPTTFYSFIGLAVSTDGGETFEDLGEIIRPDITVSDPDRPTHGGVDVGSATYVINNGYFYVYHKDMTEDGTDVRMAVSRAPIQDVLSAAENGTTSLWQKYHNGSFSSPGIGGSADNIMPITPSYISWMDTIYLEALDEYVMVYSSINDGTIGSMSYITTSKDGINWTMPSRIYDDFSDEEISFVTLSSTDYSSQRVVKGNSFEMFRTVSASQYDSGNRWLDAWVEKINISFSIADNSGTGDAGSQSDADSSATLASTGVNKNYLLVVAVLLLAASGVVFYKENHIS